MLCHSTPTAPTHLMRVEPIVSGLLLGLWPCAMRYRLFGYAVRAPADSPLIVERQSFLTLPLCFYISEIETILFSTA